MTSAAPTTEACPACGSENTAVNMGPPFMRCEDCGHKFRGPETCHLCDRPVTGPWNERHGVGTCTTPEQTAAFAEAERANERLHGRQTEAEMAVDLGHGNWPE